MIIAIDASRAVKPHPTGTELYSLRLIEELAKLESPHTFWLYTPTPPPARLAKLPAHFVWKVIPFRRLWTQIRLALALWQDKPDLLFVPAHVPPFLASLPTVVTIHDLAYRLFPEAYSLFNRWYSVVADRLILNRARAVIVPSQSTRHDLLKLYRSQAAKIQVIPLGYDQPKASSAKELPADIKALQPYFLMIGRLETRKNTALAIEAFGQFKAHNPQLPHWLVLVGKPGHGYEAIQEAIARLTPDQQQSIVQVGYVDDATRNHYLVGAQVFLYPSLYEGFGLPLLEAMATGVPIITSDAASMPEVVDDAAILVNPHTPNELVKAMELLAINQLSRQQIIQRGKDRVRQFNWSKTAELTHQLLSSLEGEDK